MSKFRLGTLERLREKQEQISARQLQECTAAVAEAVNEREKLVAQLAATGTGTVGGHLAMASLYRDRLREDIETATAEIDRRTALLAAARDDWAGARAALRAVQTLHEKHRDAMRAGAARQEQAELDEFAGTRSRIMLGGFE
jgi:flagellar export protein FliJ